jgi:hypothetical protein
MHSDFEDAIYEVNAELQLPGMLAALTRKHFPRLAGKPLPTIHVKRLAKDGPAYLDAVSRIIYLDDRVITFQQKTVPILILHELIHWQLCVDKVPNPTDESSPAFLDELYRLLNARVYDNLL